MASRKRPAGKAAFPDVLVLTELDQVRALADPLRVRLVEAFCAEERTTKQVADLLGEKPTKLYHHVDALVEAGILRLTRTRQKRGTLEKYYRAVARLFRADSSLFGGDRRPGEEETLDAVVDTILDTTRDELHQLAAEAEPAADFGEDAILSFCEIQATAADIVRLRRRVARLLKDVQGDGEEPQGELERYRLTVAFYPVPAPDRKSR